ncbi:MAG: immunoglobulin-like domain-containing protein [Bacillota bacterium]
MKKKFLLMLMVFFLAIGFAACTPAVDPIDEESPVLSGYHNFTYIIDESATPNYLTGVTAFDNLDGNITSKIVVDSSAVNLEVPGTYNVKYSVTDLSGNLKEITVTVAVIDSTAPMISGVAGISYVIGDPAPDYIAGLTATDNVDGDITADIVADSSAVNLTVAGLYTVTFTVEDAAGNVSATYSTYVQVKQYADDADLVPPTFNGQRNYSYIIGYGTAPDYLTGVTATDNVDGDVSASIVVDSSAVNLAVPGVYTVVYTAEDAFGNVATVTVTVTVIQETVPPVISGIRVLEFYIGDAVPNYVIGVTATDEVDGDLTSAIIVDATGVNLLVAGRYPVLYSVTDAAGNVATAETEIVVAVNPISLIPDLTATYRTYTSGTDNLNPYSETLATASTLNGYLVDSLYTGDYDWVAARQILVDEGAVGLPATISFDEWYAGGHTAGQLPYNRYPAMATTEPVAMDTEGLVWQITLRNDLEFEDGTVIDANTFDYSWKQLIDPLLLNDRASNLYSTTDLPLVGAEDYFKQASLKTDSLGYRIYDVGGTLFARENSYYGTVIGYPTWLLYYPEAPFDTLVGPAHDVLVAGQKAYVEYWGTGYGVDGYVLVDELDNAFMFAADGSLVAPYAGWTLEGVAVPTEGGVDYGGCRPAYMDSAGNLPASLTDGIPTGGTALANDPVAWSTVGFKVISQYTFEITLKAGRTAWDVMGALSSGIVGVVHPAAYEAGMNAGRTQTNYGTIDNPLVSYGPFTLSAWETDVLYFYTLNPDHYAASDFRMTKVRYDVIEDQSIAVSEFKEGRLDIVGAGGQYYTEFKYNKNLKLSPATTFFRFAFNIEGSDAYELNPILTQDSFRQAFYFAIDRETFSSDVRAPSLPTFGFLGPVYLSTEYNFVSYRGSVPGQDVLDGLSPDTFGYDPVRAKTLFDEAYAAAILAGDIQDGELVAVEYKFYDVETNWQVANWVKDTVETIFNTGETAPIFQLDLVAVSSAALNQAWDNGDFEMTFGGWQGLNFDAPSMLGQVYNSALAYMLEKGFNTAGAVVTVALPNSKVALESWIADYLLIVAPTDSQTAQYDDWVALLAQFVGNEITVTYDRLFNIAYGELYNVADVNFTGKTDDFDAITAALEGVLLDQMIAIPLFTTVAATVYSTRIVFEANEYHAWMAWGGEKYMFIGKEA